MNGKNEDTMLEFAMRDISMILGIDEEQLEHDMITLEICSFEAFQVGTQAHEDFNYEITLPCGRFQIRVGVPHNADDTYNGGFFRFAATLPNGRSYWSEWIESRTLDECI